MAINERRPWRDKVLIKKMPQNSPACNSNKIHMWSGSQLLSSAPGWIAVFTLMRNDKSSSMTNIIWFLMRNQAFILRSPLFSSWEEKNIWENFIPFSLSEKYLFFFYILVIEEKNHGGVLWYILFFFNIRKIFFFFLFSSL